MTTRGATETRPAAFVVLLRGVNVGGHRRFEPTKVAAALAALGVTSHGAAGTFVARAARDADSLRDAMRARLPFPAEVLVLPAKDVLALVRARPFGTRAPPAGVKRYVTVLAEPPRARPRLPIEKPKGTWEVRVTSLRGRFACSLWRRRGTGILYPNAVVEKALGVPATTRGWETLLAVAEAI